MIRGFWVLGCLVLDFWVGGSELYGLGFLFGIWPVGGWRGGGAAFQGELKHGRHGTSNFLGC